MATTYSFKSLPAGYPVKVYAAGDVGGTLVASGTADTNGTLSVALAEGSYVADVDTGHYHRRAASEPGFGAPAAAASESSRNVTQIAYVGDSIANNAGIIDLVTPTNSQFWRSNGYLHVANALLGGRATLVYPTSGLGTASDPNSGLHGSAPSGIGWTMAGLTAAEVELLGYMDAAAASAASIIHEDLGTNDINAGVTGDTVAATKLRLWRKATARGKRVLGSTLLPRDSTVITGAKLTELNKANRLIRQYAATEPGVYLCDWHAALLDPTTGAAPSGSAWSSFFIDGLHPNPLGGWRLGIYLASILAPLIGPRTPLDHLPIDPADVLTPNPFGLGGTTIPTSWTLSNVGSPTSVVSSLVARKDGVPGSWTKVVTTAATQNTDGFTITLTDSTTSTWAAGDYGFAFFELLLDNSAGDWNCRGLQGDLVKSGVSTIASANNLASSDRTQFTRAYDFPALSPGQTLVPLTLITPRVQLDAGLTAVRSVLRSYGSSTLWVGRSGVVKVS